MAWLPIQGIVPQVTESGNQANGYVLKFYEAGTTTPLAVATDNTGATTATNFPLDSEGYTTLSTVRVIPHVDQSYKEVLYLNQADADADATGSAVYVVDNVGVAGSLASQISYDNTTSGLTATNVQSAIDENSGDIDDLNTTLGVSRGDTNMGSFTGTVLTDNTTAKANIQELGTQVDTNVTDIATNTTDIATNTSAIAAITDPVSLVSTTAITAISDIDIDLDFSTYSKYELVIDGGLPANDGVIPQLQLGHSAGSFYTGSQYHRVDYVSSATPALAGSVSASNIRLSGGIQVGNGSDEGLCGTIEITSTAGAVRNTSVSANIAFHDTTSTRYHAHVTGNLDVAAPSVIDAVRLSWSAGNWQAAGNIYLYGYKRS